MANNSGLDQTIINTRTRALSSEANKLQFAAAKMQAQALKRQYNDTVVVGSYSEARGKTYESTVDASPLSSDVFNGLKVRPFSTHLLVEPGVVGMRATTANYDSTTDSDYIVINDAGVTDSLALVFAANPAGTQRVDVVECAPIEVNGTASRDVYDPSSGTFFPPALLTVTRKISLQYRIRQGTAGAGFPGTAVGWLPLAVAIHRAGSASFTDVDFYDVRPLVAERRNQTREYRGAMFNSGNRHQYGCTTGGNLEGNFDTVANCMSVPVNGAFGGPWTARGLFCRTMPGAANSVETQNLPTTNSSNPYYTASTPTVLTDRWLYVISAEPFGLPRWSKYTTNVVVSTGEREPANNWGLYVILDDNGWNSVLSPGNYISFVLPVGYGLGSPTVVGQIVAIYRQNGLTNAVGMLPRVDSLHSSTYSGGFGVHAGTGAGASASPIVSVFTLSSLNDLPLYVTGFRALVEFDVEPNVDCTCTLSVVLKRGGTAISPVHKQSIGFVPATDEAHISANVDFVFPIYPMPEPGGTTTVQATITMTGSVPVTITMSNPDLTIHGIYVGT